MSLFQPAPQLQPIYYSLGRWVAGPVSLPDRRRVVESDLVLDERCYALVSEQALHLGFQEPLYSFLLSWFQAVHRYGAFVGAGSFTSVGRWKDPGAIQGHC